MAVGVPRRSRPPSRRNPPRGELPPPLHPRDRRRRSRTFRSSALDLQVATLPARFVGRERLPGGSLKHRSASHVELRAVARADHGDLLEISLCQRTPHVCASVVEGVERTSYIGDGDLGAMHVERPHLTLSQIPRSGHRCEFGHCSQPLSVLVPSCTRYRRNNDISSIYLIYLNKSCFPATVATETYRKGRCEYRLEPEVFREHTR